MSRLQLHGRQWVVFDAKNKEHRRWFADFNKTGAWGQCPVRFVVNDDHGDLITQIQRELIAHYVNKEFVSTKNKSFKVDNKSKKHYNISIAKQ
jgi:hypothetical protein